MWEYKNCSIKSWNKCCILFAQNVRSAEDLQRTTSHCKYSNPELLNDYIGEELDGLPKEFIHILQGVSNKQFIRFNYLTPNIRNAALQIINCPFTYGAKQLFLKSKAFELLTLQIDQFYSDPAGSFFSPSLLSRELEKINYARELLIKRIDSPPALFELSKKVGLSHTKLNQRFRVLYGKTVFEYLRAYRLKYAKAQLTDTNKTITEIAYMCGYRKEKKGKCTMTVK